MGLVLPPIEVYQVQHLPIVKAYADKIGLVEAINQLVPMEMAIDPGTIVLGMILDTLSGRSPLYRLAEFFTHAHSALRADWLFRCIGAMLGAIGVPGLPARGDPEGS